MPGPFTLILPKKDIIPDIVSGGLDTIGIRMPSNVIARGIISFSMYDWREINVFICLLITQR